MSGGDRGTAGTVVLVASLAVVLVCTGLLFWQVADLRAALAAKSPGPDGRAVAALLERSLPSETRDVVLASEPARRIVLFVFTPADCSACLEELPVLEQIQATHEDVRVFALLSHSNLDEAKQLREAFGLSYPILQDPDGSLLDSLDLPKTPWKILVDLRRRAIVYDEPPSVTAVEREAFASRVSTLDAL